MVPEHRVKMWSILLLWTIAFIVTRCDSARTNSSTEIQKGQQNIPELCTMRSRHAPRQLNNTVVYSTTGAVNSSVWRIADQNATASAQFMPLHSCDMIMDQVDLFLHKGSSCHVEYAIRRGNEVESQQESLVLYGWNQSCIPLDTCHHSASLEGFSDYLTNQQYGPSTLTVKVKTSNVQSSSCLILASGNGPLSFQLTLTYVKTPLTITTFQPSTKTSISRPSPTAGEIHTTITKLDTSFPEQSNSQPHPNTITAMQSESDNTKPSSIPIFKTTEHPETQLPTDFATESHHSSAALSQRSIITISASVSIIMLISITVLIIRLRQCRSSKAGQGEMRSESSPGSTRTKEEGRKHEPNSLVQPQESMSCEAQLVAGASPSESNVVKQSQDVIQSDFAMYETILDGDNAAPRVACDVKDGHATAVPMYESTAYISLERSCNVTQSDAYGLPTDM
eukprot:scpid79345/ scgid23593/ 